MIVQEIPLTAIDFSNESYRMSYFRDHSVLRQSITEVGLLNPLLLWQASDAAPYTVICGYQRLQACRELGHQQVSACCYRASELLALEAFRISLFDNLTVRAFNPIEKAMVLQRLRMTFRLPGETIVRFYNPLLGLPPQRTVLDDYLSLLTLPPAIQEAVVQDRLSLASALRLARWKSSDAEALFGLIRELRLGVNRQRELLDWVEELAHRLNRDIAHIARQPEIEALASDAHLPPPQRAERVQRILWSQRFPHLAQQAERFRVHMQALDLAPGMRVSHDPFFNDPHLKIEFPFTSVSELRAAAQKLLTLAENPALRKLLDLL